jgi:ATP-dependent protease ClpP protease subunit
MEYSEPSCSRKDRGSGSNINIRRVDNTIYFSDRISYESAHELNILLAAMERDILEDIEKVESVAKKEKTKYTLVKVEPRPIVLVLTTHGGLVHAAFSVVDTIMNLRVPVYTVVSGYVASAGTLISLAGTKRIIRPNAFMMIHEIRSGFWGRYSDHVVEHTNITKLMDHIIAYYIKQFVKPITREALLEMLKRDTDLSATECLELGLVDKVDAV